MKKKLLKMQRLKLRDVREPAKCRTLICRLASQLRIDDLESFECYSSVCSLPASKLLMVAAVRCASSRVWEDNHPWSLVTGEVWSPVIFGYRWSLVTGDLWLPVTFGHQWSLVIGEVWSLVIFGHRWSLVTGDLWLPVKFGHWRKKVTSDLLVTGYLWSLVKFGHWQGHRWSWADVLQPVTLLLVGESISWVSSPTA